MDLPYLQTDVFPRADPRMQRRQARNAAYPCTQTVRRPGESYSRGHPFATFSPFVDPWWDLRGPRCACPHCR